LGSCVTVKEPVGMKLLERSASKIPSWAGKSWEEKNTLYFTGSATGSSSFEQARELAIRDASTKIVEYFGFTQSVKFKRILTETSRYLLDEVSGKSKEKQIKGVQIKEVYYERWLKESNKVIYNVHLLVSYDKQEMEKEKKRLAQEEKAKTDKVKSLFANGQQKIAEGYVNDGVQNYIEALNSLDETDNFRQDIIAEIKNTLNLLRIEKVNSPKSITATKAIEESLELKLYLVKNENKLPLKNCPVKFTFVEGEGQLDETVYSDMEGKIRSVIHKIKTVGNIVVRAGINFDNLNDVKDDEAFTKADNIHVDYEFNAIPTQKNIKLTIEIKEIFNGNAKKSALAENEVNKQLNNYGYKTLTGPETNKADIRVYCEINISQNPKNEVGVFSCSTNGQLKVLNIKNSKTLLENILKEVTGYGIVDEQAKKDAINKISKNISDLVVNILEK